MLSYAPTQRHTDVTAGSFLSLTHACLSRLFCLQWSVLTSMWKSSIGYLIRICAKCCHYHLISRKKKVHTYIFWKMLMDSVYHIRVNIINFRTNLYFLSRLAVKSHMALVSNCFIMTNAVVTLASQKLYARVS